MVLVLYSNVKTRAPTLRKKIHFLNVFVPRTLPVAEHQVQRAYFTTHKGFKPVLLSEKEKENGCIYKI